MNKRKFKKTYECIKSARDKTDQNYDVLGSYTGRSALGGKPTQDADDL
ncbi:MAG: hypothetical protein IKA97_00750 [Clostridia bacterium]|nr:hypothetical protein [Clostridia bacterium]